MLLLDLWFFCFIRARVVLIFFFTAVNKIPDGEKYTLQLEYTLYIQLEYTLEYTFQLEEALFHALFPPRSLYHVRNIHLFL